MPEPTLWNWRSRGLSGTSKKSRKKESSSCFIKCFLARRQFGECYRGGAMRTAIIAGRTVDKAHVNLWIEQSQHCA
jgi:hypothetical protein